MLCNRSHNVPSGLWEFVGNCTCWHIRCVPFNPAALRGRAGREVAHLDHCDLCFQRPAFASLAQGSWTSLRQLSLAASGLEATHIQQLTKLELPFLQQLCLSENYLDEIAIQHIVSSGVWPLLTVLDLSGVGWCMLSREAVNALSKGNWPFLEEISLITTSVDVLAKILEKCLPLLDVLASGRLSENCISYQSSDVDLHVSNASRLNMVSYGFDAIFSQVKAAALTLGMMMAKSTNASPARLWSHMKRVQFQFKHHYSEKRRTKSYNHEILVQTVFDFVGESSLGGHSRPHT